MANRTPHVRRKQLLCPVTGQPLCVLDSAAWFAWLETATSFRFFSTGQRIVYRHYSVALAPISVRKEQRRRGYLWYAYRRDDGILYKRYVGKTAALTCDRLDDIALALNEV